MSLCARHRRPDNGPSFGACRRRRSRSSARRPQMTHAHLRSCGGCRQRKFQTWVHHPRRLSGRCDACLPRRFLTWAPWRKIAYMASRLCRVGRPHRRAGRRRTGTAALDRMTSRFPCDGARLSAPRRRRASTIRRPFCSKEGGRARVLFNFLRSAFLHRITMPRLSR